MIIINKEKNVAINFNNVDAIGFKTNEKEKKTIVAHLISGTSVELGSYPTEERAKEVYDTLLDVVNYVKKYCMPNDDDTEDIIDEIKRG